MNKLSIYERSIKDIKAAFYDIITYEETQSNNEKVTMLKTKMADLINLLNQELETNDIKEVKENQEEISIPKKDIIPIDFSQNSPTNEEKNILEQTINLEQKEEPTPEIELKEEVKTEEQNQVMKKIDNKKARAILVLDKQITKLRNSREEKKTEINKLIKENEDFMKSVSVPNEPTDTEQKVKELEDQIKKYYSENNFEMAEKLLNQIKELSN